VCVLDALDGRLPVTDRTLVREPVSVPGLQLHLAVPSAR